MFKKPDNAYSSIDQPKKHQEKNYGNNLENNKTCDMKALQGMSNYMEGVCMSEHNMRLMTTEGM